MPSFESQALTCFDELRLDESDVSGVCLIFSRTYNRFNPLQRLAAEVLRQAVEDYALGGALRDRAIVWFAEHEIDHPFAFESILHWILPSMHPDTFRRSLRQRYPAGRVDRLLRSVA